MDSTGYQQKEGQRSYDLEKYADLGPWLRRITSSWIYIIFQIILSHVNNY